MDHQQKSLDMNLPGTNHAFLFESTAHLAL